MDAGDALYWIVQELQDGQAVDYAGMKPGELGPVGEEISTCPKCGRAGLVHEYDNIHKTYHVIRVFSERGNKGFREEDVCKLPGNRW